MLLFYSNPKGVSMGAYSVLWPIHAILMGVSFAAMAAGIIIAVFYKKKRWRLKAHKIAAYGGVVGAVIALVLAIIMVSLSHGAHFSSFHGIFGIITLIFVVSAPVFAELVYKSRAKPNAKKGLRKVHIVIGVVSLGMMTVTILYGLRIAGIIYF